MIAVINSNPAIKNAGHYFQQENNNELGFTQTATNKKFCFGGKPRKQYKINGKQEIFQAVGIWFTK
jgi:hypothetical protein